MFGLKKVKYCRYLVDLFRRFNYEKVEKII